MSYFNRYKTCFSSFKEGGWEMLFGFRIDFSFNFNNFDFFSQCMHVDHAFIA